MLNVVTIRGDARCKTEDRQLPAPIDSDGCGAAAVVIAMQFLGV